MVCDLEDDGNLDVVVTYSFSNTESYIDAYDLNGSQKTNLGFPIQLPGKILSEVSIGDLDNDNDLEIVASIPIFTDDVHATIYVFEYNGEKFVENWHFMESMESGEIIYSPALGDIDGDGDLEIITGTQRYEDKWTSVIYALHHDGTMVSGWPVSNKVYYGSYYPTPALGDIDDDGYLEVVVGTYFNYLYAWNNDGKLVSGEWPVNINDNIRSHSPQLGDLDGDGVIEIVQIGAKYGNINILDGQGKIIQILYPNIADFSCTPALGDIDGDSDLEIFANIGSYIYGWHHDGEKVAGSWPVLIDNLAHSGRASIIFGNIDDDFLPDLVYMRENSEDGSDIFAFHANGSLINGWPYSFDNANNLRSSPTLIDIDKDGDLEIVFTYNNIVSPPNNSSYTIDILDINGYYDALTMHWPMFQYSPRHTGLYNKPCNNPPDKPSIEGPVNGIVRKKYTYNAITNDPDDDNISYLFDWDDGTNSDWTEFVPSGTKINQSHKWWLKGKYEVKIKAKDSYAAQSEWTILEVTMLKNKILSNSFLINFFQRFQILQRLFNLIK